MSTPPPALLLAACLALLAAGPAGGAAPTRAGGVPIGASRLDSRLLLATRPDAEPVAVWVEFADKGEQGPADLAMKLADVERSLTPEARHRREK